jgi:hypothetical protein
MQQSDYITASLATLLTNQSKTDHLIGLGAQALMIRNRVLAGWSDWLNAINDYEKYSASPQTGRLLLGSMNDIFFIRLLGLCSNVIAGLEKDTTAGGLWCARLNEITSDKFLADIVRQPESHPRIAQVGQLVFFK